MPNTSPATVTITGTIGPGLSVTSKTFTDIVDIEYNFYENIIRITRAGAGGIMYFSYSATATVTQVITAGVTTITIS